MEFRLLGPLEALSDGRPLPIGGQKQRGVLALLLLHANEVVSTDKLIDEVWGARPPKSVDASLQNCISHLRGVVGREAIETRPPGYRLNVEADSWTSTASSAPSSRARTLDPPERAAALREALALWRGPPLARRRVRGLRGNRGRANRGAAAGRSGGAHRRRARARASRCDPCRDRGARDPAPDA